MDFTMWVGISGVMLMIASNKTPPLRTLIEKGKHEGDYEEIRDLRAAATTTDEGRQLHPPMHGASDSIQGIDRLGCIGLGSDDVPRWERTESNSVGSFRERIHRDENDRQTSVGLVLDPMSLGQGAYEAWKPHW